MCLHKRHKNNQRLRINLTEPLANSEIKLLKKNGTKVEVMHLLLGVMQLLNELFM